MKRIPALMVLWAAASPLAWAADEPLAKHVPAGAAAYFELESLEPLYQQIPVAEWQKVVEANPQYRKFRTSDQFQQVEAAKALAAGYFGMDMQTLGSKLLATKLGVAVFPKPDKGRPDFVVVAHFADKQSWDRIKTASESLLNLFAAGKISKSLRVEGRAVVNVDGKVYYVVDGTTVIVSNSRDLITKSAKSLAGSSDAKSLADDATYKAADRSTGGNNVGRFYLDQQQLRVAMKSKRFGPEKLDNFLGTLLFQDAFELALTSDVLGGGIEARGKQAAFTFTVPGSPARLGDLFQGFFLDPAKAGSPKIPHVPGYLGGVTLHRDVGDLYRKREKLLDERVQPDFDKFESGINNVLPGKSFSADLMPLLGHQLTLIAARQDFKGLGGAAPAVKLPAFALIAETPKPKEAGDVVSLFFQAIVPIMNFTAKENGNAPQLLETEAYKGVQVQHSRFLDKPKGEKLPIGYNFQATSATVGNHLILASSVELCKTLVDHYQAGPAREPNGRNLVFDLSPDALALLAKDNEDQLIAGGLREGKTLEQAKEELGYALAALKTLSSLEISTQVRAADFQVRIEVNWK